MRRMPLKLVIAAVGLVGVLAAASLVLMQVYLGTSFGRSQPTITVKLDETGGVFERSAVTYRGVRVGRVEEIKTTATGVEVKLKLRPGTEIPVDSNVAVRTLSPAGEQFLDFQPAKAGGPYLQDGAVINNDDRVSTPTTMAESLASIENLISQLDPVYLESALDELNAAFPNPDTLGEIITTGQSIIQTLDETWPQTQSLLRNGNTALRTGIAVGGDLRQIAPAAERLTAWAKAYDARARQHLDGLPTQVEELRRFTSLVGLKLPAVLGEMIAFTDLTVPEEQYLRNLLDGFPAGFEKFSTVFTGGRLNTLINISTDGNVCWYNPPGQGNNPEPDRPASEREAVDNDRQCTSPGQGRGSHTVMIPQ